MSTLTRYLLHTIDLQNENPWENKGIYMLYTDLVLGFLRVLLYLVFMSLMIKIHTFPLFAIRPMYMALRSFKKTLNDVIMSQRAIRNLNIMYPDVTQEQLRTRADTTCIICREEMLLTPPNDPNAPAAQQQQQQQQQHQHQAQQIKKLPCDHIFHKSCLRSWFQRQQTCPTCRTPILRLNPAAAAANMPQAPPPAAAAQANAQLRQAPVAGAGAPQPAANAAQAQPAQPHTPAAASANSAVNAGQQQHHHHHQAAGGFFAAPPPPPNAMFAAAFGAGTPMHPTASDSLLASMLASSQPVRPSAFGFMPPFGNYVFFFSVVLLSSESRQGCMNLFFCFFFYVWQ